MKKDKDTRAIEIRRCPSHGFWAIVLDEGDGCGRRLTSGKCCGRWDLVKAWPLKDADVQDMIDDLQKLLTPA